MYKYHANGAKVLSASAEGDGGYNRAWSVGGRRGKERDIRLRPSQKWA